jgi:hypothetical protein
MGKRGEGGSLKFGIRSLRICLKPFLNAEARRRGGRKNPKWNGKNKKRASLLSARLRDFGIAWI